MISTLADKVILTPYHHDGPGSNGKITRVVIHGTVSPCVVGGAENNAHYFQSASAGGAAHYCLTPYMRVLTDDLRWIPIGDLAEGDGLVGLDEFPAAPRPRYMKPSVVERVEHRVADCLEVVMDDGRTVVCSTDHRWLRRQTTGRKAASWLWVATEDMAVGDELAAPLKPWARGGLDMAWLGGLIDGEGCWTKTTSNRALVFSQKSGAVLDRGMAVLDAHELPWTISDNGHNVKVIRISGLAALMQVLGQARPVRFLDRQIWDGSVLGSWRYPHGHSIAAIRHVGQREVVSIQTSTRTFFAEGIASHNCVDPGEIVSCVDEDQKAAHAPPNAGSIGIELCDPQTGDPARWDDDDHRAMLKLAAKLVVDICARHQLPLVWLSSADLLAGKTGITGHVQVAQAFHQSDHTDPRDMPIDKFMALVAQPVPQPSPEDTLNFHYAQHKGDPKVYLVNLASAPRHVELFRDAEFWAITEGHTVVNTGSQTLGADGNGDTRKGEVLDDKGAALFGLI